MTVSTASFTALGTGAAVTVLDERALPAAHEIVLDELRCIDEACSPFRDDSELALLNRSAGVPFAASPLLLEALMVAVYAAARTDGDVDPTVGRSLGALGWNSDFTVVVARRRETPRLRIVPAAGWQRIRIDRRERTVRIPAGVEIDLGATAKALAADRCAQRVLAATGTGALVNLGGDIAVAGAAPVGGWAILVTDDHRSDVTADGQTVAHRNGRARDVEHHRAPAANRRNGDASHRRSTQRRARGRDLAHGQRGRAHLRRGQYGEHLGDRARRRRDRLARARRAPGAAGSPRRDDRHDGRVARGGRGMNQMPVWYLMRASGVVSLLLLTIVSALGVATVGRWRPGSVPRFVTLGLHRSVSLLAVAFLAVHVLTAVIDPDATVAAIAVVVPAPSDRYGLWLGLAALAFDLVVALVITSLLRHRIAPRVWRAVHYAAYLAWPVALLHGAGMGTDSSSAWMLAVDAACIAIFGGAVALRLLKVPSRRGPSTARRPACEWRRERRGGRARAAAAPRRASASSRPRERLRRSPHTSSATARMPSLRGESDALIAAVEASGLRGRGGAGFPTHRKLRAVAARRNPVVVANGVEGEPASHKDALLMRINPHLVLDGAAAAAAAVGAKQIVIAVGRGAAGAHAAMAAAIAERSTGGREGFELVAVPERFVAGEESALVNWLNGGPAKPTFVPPAAVRARSARPVDAGAERRDARGHRAHRSLRGRLVPRGRQRTGARIDARHLRRCRAAARHHRARLRPRSCGPRSSAATDSASRHRRC